jgi:hypothetical protein
VHALKELIEEVYRYEATRHLHLGHQANAVPTPLVDATHVPGPITHIKPRQSASDALIRTEEKRASA